MNKKQKVVIYIGIFLLLLIGLLSPYIGNEGYGSRVKQKFIGYHLLFSSPSSLTVRKHFAGGISGEFYSSSIDISRFSIQFIILIFLIISFCIILKDKK